MHVIVGLGQGGAETMLWRLLLQTDPARISSSVVSLSSEDALAPRIAQLGVPVYKLGLRSLGSGLAGLVGFWRLIRRIRPDVIQGWMSHGNLAGLLARIAGSGHPALVWGIRQSIYDLAYEKPSTARLIRLSARLSGQPQAIVYNSHAGRAHHEALGFSRGSGLVIPNGFDVSAFAPSSDARASLRRELNLPDDAPLVGIVGRFHPMKDHRTFINAAAAVLRSHPRCRFILVGPDVDRSNKALSGFLQDAGLSDAAHLLGIRDDMPRINAALDVAVSSSFTEAFPTAIGEAMSCGVPCVVTDVGDSARLVGDTGIVVPPRSPEKLASGIAGLLDLSFHDREALGARARVRVVSEYSLDNVANSYNSLYLSFVKNDA